MAEAILSTVAGEILMKLGSGALQEIGVWWGVKDELEKLKRSVLTIQAVLRQAEKQHTMSDQLKNLVDNLKEVLYDADDMLDDFSTKALRRQVVSGNKMAKEVRTFFSPSNQVVNGRKMSQKIKATRERLDDIKGDKEFHIVEGTVVTRVETSHRETDSVIPLEGVIGREKEKEEIIKCLLGSNLDENVVIIPIVGIGGLGKTTLAQFVYNDDMVKNHFELQIWVSVSDVFDVKAIVKNIIKAASATNNELELLQLDQLQKVLRKELDGKKYLLVLDDVWNDNREKWDQLRKYLMGGARGSRIVVTTRAQQVAELTSRVPPYILEGLSETNSWSLFVKWAFREQQEPTNQNIVAIGKEIVKKCSGVPLAIRTMGRLLYSRKLEDEWTFFNTELSQLPQEDGDILPTLKLSYNNLEPHLKHCFAYCRLFPKDHEIDVKTLIYLWIAQGVIKSSNSSQSLEQIGYEYFLFLLWRSFFQEPKEGEWGKIVCCKMHDLMHDLAVQVAEEESTMINLDKDINIPRNTRHVSIDYDFPSSWKNLAPLLKAKKIRTFLLTKGLPKLDKEIWSHTIVSEFRRLRMLDLHDSWILRLPDSIGKLKHLRYLDLSGNRQLEMLPSSIARLQNLLVLNLSDCYSLKELPNDIKNLVSLEHLDIDGCDSLTHMPLGLGQLTSLQTLTRFIVSKDHSVSKHCGRLNDLYRLNNLRGELVLENLEHVKNADSEYKAANLEGKEHLQSLILRWGRFDDNENIYNFDAMSVEGLQPHKNLKKLEMCYYPGVKFPNWLSSLSNLVNLEFKYCRRVKHLPPLDELSSLRHLSINDLRNLEYIECNGSLTSLISLAIDNCERLKSISGVFQHCTALEELVISLCKELDFSDGMQYQGLRSLSSLQIDQLPQLVSLPEDLQHVTTLQVLGISWCYNLKTLPDWIASLNSLQELKINSCPELWERCGNNMGVDWPKISHIPNIEIYYIKIQSGGCYELGQQGISSPAATVNKIKV